MKLSERESVIVAASTGFRAELYRGRLGKVVQHFDGVLDAASREQVEALCALHGKSALLYAIDEDRGALFASYDPRKGIWNEAE